MGPAKCILHVDDDPDFTRLVARTLNKSGYQVTTVHDPEMAMREVAKGHHLVVLVDIDMPKMDGLELLQLIKIHDGAIRVIAVSGVLDHDSILRAMHYGADDCLFKPLTSFDPLLAAVEDAFAIIRRWRKRLMQVSERDAEQNEKSVSDLSGAAP